MAARADHHLAAIAVEEAASLLARLAREKASAEQVRDALRLGTEELSRQVGFHVGRELDERDRATRAEQEIARLLDEMRKIADVGKNRRTGETGYMGEHHAECQAIAERALAAAAGAEEPRSARPISEQTQAELKALDEAAGMGRHRLRGFLTGKAEEPR